MAFIASLDSTVASWALSPHGTFNPAASQSCKIKSTLCNCDEIGMTKTSPLKLPIPTTTAGRTLRLVRSVNGIGRRIMSPIEKLIENIVRGIFPSFRQSLLGQTQPRLPLGAATGIIRGLNNDRDARMVRQRQFSRKFQDPMFVNGFNRCRHEWKVSPALTSRKAIAMSQISPIRNRST